MSDLKWWVSCEHEVLVYLAKVKMRDFYFDPKACTKAFKEGRKRLVELFGKEIVLPNISVPHLSYGHLACLGAHVDFPENSAPCVKPLFPTIDKGVETLQRKVDFSESKLFKHFYKIYQHLKKEFPEEKVSIYGFGWEGPVTSAVMLRGKAFLADLYRTPHKAEKFLDLLTDSIIEYVYFLRRLMGEPEVNPSSTGLCDDCAAYIPPRLWDRFVLPYWNKYFSNLTKGKRHVHVEGLYPQHLKYLEKAHISHYDPSISPKLTPKIISRTIKIPFSWRLPSFQYPYMAPSDIEKWVYKSYEEGARELYTVVEPLMCTKENITKVKTFIKTCKKLKENNPAQDT